MTFAAPIFLLSLVLLAAIVAAYVFRQRARPRYALRYTNVGVLADVADRLPRRHQYVPPALFALALLSLLVGVARPTASVVLPREEATVVLVLDVSGSMSATDIPPTRLEVAKGAAVEFLHALPPKFQVGVVAFSDRAEVLAHPTVDRTAVRDALLTLTANGGTAIGDAIVQSLKLDPAGGTRIRRSGEPLAEEDLDVRPLTAVLLLSDGRNTTGKVDPMTAAARARSMRLPVYTIALGPDEELSESAYRIGGVEPPDYDALRAIAETTGAAYFGAPSREHLRAVYEGLASRLGFVKEHQEVTFAFAAAGVVFAGAALVLAALWSWRLP